ncbi:uncharacterized protein N7515_005858 [Penicillium bovifimosum]|uniref:Uncharacterized protein n=1 Tax=Penicillium bovifimosum TaxID=126998 RepID=A0A9W9GV87_9EURO|nr:uncharacterized protein N7515_005858 [Penicillium bovifimosum]KAJ5129819.1 hypothetical protein N7515_005858 [Penicillium bovifimosum]
MQDNSPARTRPNRRVHVPPPRIPRPISRTQAKHVLVRLTLHGHSHEFEEFKKAIEDLPDKMKVEVTDAYETDKSIFILLNMTWETWAMWTMAVDLEVVGITRGPSFVRQAPPPPPLKELPVGAFGTENRRPDGRAQPDMSSAEPLPVVDPALQTTITTTLPSLISTPHQPDTLSVSQSDNISTLRAMPPNQNEQALGVTEAPAPTRRLPFVAHPEAAAYEQTEVPAQEEFKLYWDSVDRGNHQEAKGFWTEVTDFWDEVTSFPELQGATPELFKSKPRPISRKRQKTRAPRPQHKIWFEGPPVVPPTSENP